MFQKNSGAGNESSSQQGIACNESPEAILFSETLYTRETVYIILDCWEYARHSIVQPKLFYAPSVPAPIVVFRYLMMSYVRIAIINGRLAVACVWSLISYGHRVALTHYLHVSNISVYVWYINSGSCGQFTQAEWQWIFERECMAKLLDSCLDILLILDPLFSHPNQGLRRISIFVVIYCGINLNLLRLSYSYPPSLPRG